MRVFVSASHGCVKSASISQELEFPVARMLSFVLISLVTRHPQPHSSLLPMSSNPPWSSVYLHQHG